MYRKLYTIELTMKKYLPRCISFLTLLFIGLSLIALLFPSSSRAQGPFNIATTEEVSDTDAVNGDIIRRNEDETLTRSSQSYDPAMIGVVAENAIIVYHEVEGEGIPIVWDGETMVNVTTLGGPIASGDPITSSAIAGKGQKASTNASWLLGSALESFSDEDGTPTEYEGRQIRQGTIRVRLSITPGQVSEVSELTKLIDQIGTLFLSNIETPERTERLFRYILAALIAIASIAIGFGSFGKNVTRGIEAIGRNPLARTQIQAMIVLNIILIATITIGGIILSLVIVRF